MKVGLFLGNMSPTEGGAYTLVVNQLTALSRLYESCGHTIVLFYRKKGEALAAQFGKFPSVNLDAQRFGVKTQQEVDEIVRRQEEQHAAELEQRAAEFAQRTKAFEAFLVEKRLFEQRLARIKRFSDFATRVYAALYRPVSPESQMGAVPSTRAEEKTQIPETEASWIDDIYKREGIQFVLYLAPWFEDVVVDVPFGIVVWDLQHRDSPWFPEVSTGAEWNRREHNYARILRRATVIYTGTQRGAEEIAAYYQVPLQRIKVLPFVAPLDALEEARSPLKAAPSKLDTPGEYLFYPAQFWAHKNHVLVLEACKIVRERSGWNLGVVFTGSDKGNQNYVRDYARRLGLDRDVRFLGFVDRIDILDLYRRAFCLVFPTFFGPDNLPPLEAFAIGCPVVASDIPGAREQLGEGAILVPPTDAQAFAEAILNLRDDEVRTKAVNAGLAVTGKASWDDYVQRIIDSLDEFAAIRRTWP
ncbi:glycosyltransferase family 4 protein [Bradyrhizobium sp. CCBAU 51745]|uniref:glycosyltransferase family 4 protein n=1 Tax=Bradyrhizobium sp. CCBAU 51745 TaxID=1325099 RepID=UPI002305EFC2|nr:glycosyltransferase family 1 protein [Bradyrhizobium sp. CCBAU 51745]